MVYLCSCLRRARVSSAHYRLLILVAYEYLRNRVRVFGRHSGIDNYKRRYLLDFRIFLTFMCWRKILASAKIRLD